jgi:hypothetical protein
MREMSAYIFTTDNPNIFLVAVGEDENEAKTVAEQAISTRPSVKLLGFQLINHSVVVGLDVTILTKAKSDDVLIRKILAYFGEGSPIELRNSPQTDGVVVKRFFVEGEGRVDLQLKNPEQIADYEKNGLGDQYVDALIKQLKPFIKRKAKPRVAPVILAREDRKENPNGMSGEVELSN